MGSINIEKADHKAAIVTDQFRILNASNFVESVENSSNSYYVFASLPNPAPSTIGFGRTGTDVANYNSNVIPPVDSINNTNHISDTMLFGRRIGDANVRRLIKKRIGHQVQHMKCIDMIIQ